MKNTKPYVFDTLTHFVTDDRAEKRKPIGIDGYLSYVNAWSNPNIRGINLLTGACPQYERGGRILLPCKWDVRNGKIEEFSYKTINGQTQEVPVDDGCYDEVNGFLQKELRLASLKHPELKLFQSPMIHPRRVSIAELERSLEHGGETVLGIKVHGISSASGPNDFNPEAARYIANRGIPLIIHTDYNSEYQANQIVTTQDALAYLQRINNPRDWANFCLKYGIKASLQHGARNDKEVYRIIKDNQNQFTVGLGPIIGGQSERMVEKTQDYVKAMFDNLGPDHIVFCSDYPFNEDEEDLTKAVEFLSIHEQEKIFYKNAETFFGKLISE